MRTTRFPCGGFEMRSSSFERLAWWRTTGMVAAQDGSCRLERDDLSSAKETRRLVLFRPNLALISSHSLSDHADIACCTLPGHRRVVVASPTEGRCEHEDVVKDLHVKIGELTTERDVSSTALKCSRQQSAGPGSILSTTCPSPGSASCSS